MTSRTVETSPQVYARIGGVLWLIVIVAGVFSQFFGHTPPVVPGDAATTAANILVSAPLFRLDLAADLVASACYLGVTVILYELLKPVNRSLSLLAACFGLVGVTVGTVDVLNHFAPLVLMGNAQYLAAVKPDELQTLALAFLKLHGYGLSIGLVFFGFQCSLAGCLILRSSYLPRILGLLLALAGVAYLVDSFGSLLSPPVAHTLLPFVAVAGLAGDGSLSLRLLTLGVNVPEWQKVAGMERGS